MAKTSHAPARKKLQESAARNTPKTSPFITRNQLAERWACSTESLKRYERRGIIHPVKIAERMLRYRLAEIEALENESTLDREEVSA
jgi:hypothetical protein